MREEDLTTLIFQGEAKPRDRDMVTNLRHLKALRAAREAMQEALQALEANLPLDFVQVDLQEAMDNVGLIVGETLREDVVDYIFAHFCIGK